MRGYSFKSLSLREYEMNQEQSGLALTLPMFAPSGAYAAQNVPDILLN